MQGAEGMVFKEPVRQTCWCEGRLVGECRWKGDQGLRLPSSRQAEGCTCRAQELPVPRGRHQRMYTGCTPVTPNRPHQAPSSKKYDLCWDTKPGTDLCSNCIPHKA